MVNDINMNSNGIEYNFIVEFIVRYVIEINILD